ncbi:MAG: hypothetical protein ACRC78_14565 [Planktothrix sp.]
MQIQQSYQRSVNILETFNSDSTNDFKTIYVPGTVSKYDRVASLRFYGFITSLRAHIDIKSIPEMRLPDNISSTSKIDRVTAARDMEWKQPRKEMELLIKTSRCPWQVIARVSLQNRLPYYQLSLIPYLTDNLTWDAGIDCLLAARIVDAGYGKLQGADRVTIFGSVREEITTIPTDAEEITVAQSYTWEATNQSQVLLPTTVERKQLTLTNNSEDKTIFLSYGATATLNSGIALYPRGGSYEINLSNPYKGAISAISEGIAQLTGIEGV